MKKLFVSFEIAKHLKEKGFDEECLAHWNGGFKLSGQQLKLSETIMKAPLYQQVIDWFREKHKIFLLIHPYIVITEAEQRYSYKILEGIMDEDISENNFEGSFKTYYEALNKAMEETLKLIP